MANGNEQQAQQTKAPEQRGPAETPGTQEYAHRQRVKALEANAVRVLFLIGQPPYNAGETAGLPRDVAARVVAASINTPHGRRQVAQYADAPVVLTPRDPMEPVVGS